MKYVARINWNPDDYNERWNEMLARCVEVFGLPGTRYTTFVDEHFMDFIFQDDGDRLMFLTGWPAHVPDSISYLLDKDAEHEH
jgi:hypothetical protein